MAENKTQKTKANVAQFIAGIADKQTRDDCTVLVNIMKDATNAEPKMWGPSIVGFGDYHYTYESGREGDWFLAGFSPRKQNLTVYIMAGFDTYEGLMKKLGKYKTGKSCLYVKRLSDIDTKVLNELVVRSVEFMTARHGGA